MVCNRNCGLLTGAIIGGVLAILGGVLIPVGDHLIGKAVKKEAVIVNGSAAYQNWLVPGSTVYREFWIFHVLNPSEVINGSKPKFEQRGPYTYRVRYLPKENVMEGQNGTISYMLPNVASFVPDMSVGPENDNVTVLNLAIAALPAVIPGFMHTMINALISPNTTILQNRTIKEILWGYKDPFLENISLFGVKATVGVFYPYNGTSDGPYNVYTGTEDITKTAIIESYKNKRTLSYWEGHCDMINGTDGASFPPFVKKDQVLRFFSSDICRSIYGVFSEKQVVKGITLYRFIVPREAFASPTEVGDNYCFCTDREISENCTLAGVLDISACKAKRPVYISLPHFLHASKSILDNVEGLSPNEKEHETYLDIEPVTGFTLRFAKRLQVNLLVRPSKIKPLEKIKKPYVFPLLWLNESAVIGDEKAEMFRTKISGRLQMLSMLQMALIIGGSVLFLAFMGSYFICRSKKLK
ncbi:platelet glycoprotein 4 [Parus major]|uniref:platelet glycoprotein 4 n=1 Tax=Parus major TaxID=9157 RepID=UPI000771653E|nr:platelet glycoprotein 4 [Parus major]XP_015483427.1 platelet glycoprotein 4 [Parus major]XP_015483429.1 platelet glycoprotein 4 [Parus major]XP_015483431.1 platelet glycoprotein 4 [Parus major]XP_033370678.1 platelet glycoprotein 4 [Parus major]XP_033370679.1 platelet glycoprotein 4 [Parus major]XP_033370680.1 platelet glycoprotein 4 [Parus major]XP_033370681.1 platelet glycoprotein 4 [Parus major]XP_033370682.1 platelet glycoprotein 4 [Parus major]XP_033370683.1 platelet glycoprotein 4